MKLIRSFLLFFALTVVLITFFGVSNYLIDNENILKWSTLLPLVGISVIISVSITLITLNFSRYRGRILGIMVMPLIGLIPAIWIFLISFLAGGEEKAFGATIAVLLGIIGIVFGLIIGTISFLLGVKK